MMCVVKDARPCIPLNPELTTLHRVEIPYIELLTMETVSQDRSLRWYAAREPIILAVLTLMAFAAFAGVGAITNLYHKNQQFRGTRWYKRGTADMQAKSYQRAAADFRTALLFSRGNDSYELGLAEALHAQGGTFEDQAYVYLMDLREREPENGTVNLELARILATKGEKDQALRYYHNAIYALWDSNPEAQRRAAQLELAEFLVRQNALTQAQAELIALAGDLPADVGLHVRAGDLFMRTQDYDHAAAQYRQALRIDHQNTAALVGMGRAAFQMGNYTLSQRYLQDAVAAGADGDSEQSLKTVNLVLGLDPFRRQIKASQRAHIVIDAFETAGARLNSCPAIATAAAANSPANANPSSNQVPSEPAFSDQWSAMKPKITEAGLRRDPDQAEAAMDLVFSIERESSARCGTPTGADLALLLISKLHEGN